MAKPRTFEEVRRALLEQDQALAEAHEIARSRRGPVTVSRAAMEQLEEVCAPRHPEPPPTIPATRMPWEAIRC
jgi:hypothetical protein